MGNKKLKIGVIFGGCSGEHEISIISAKFIMEELDLSKFDIIPIGITKTGEWFTGDNILEQLEKAKLSHDEISRVYLSGPGSKGLLIIKPGEEKLRLTPIDVIFPVLHGPMGEDGTIQGMLELANIPYVGAGVLASAVGMDKATMKMVFQSKGLSIPRYTYFLRKEVLENTGNVIKRIERMLNYPVFVKPANLGSSVGISKVNIRNNLEQALRMASKYDRKIVVEEGIYAREIECAVLGNDDPQVSVPGEIIPSNEFYDYKAKYIDDSSQTIIPAPIPDLVKNEVMNLALEAFKAIDCAGMARVDMLLDKNSMKIYLNEINTIPGFTPISMYPKLWEASGIPCKKLLDQLIELALNRFNEKSMTRNSLDKSGLQD